MRLIINYFILFLFSCSGLATKLNTEWWKHTNIYEIILYSFKDSDGDGIGDLKGLISKLDHFVDLQVETLYLTPIYKSGLRDMGYDVSDFYDVNPKYGTLEDFDELIREMKERGLKLMMELVVNHSSDENEWFRKSIDQIEPYTDYYVWVSPKSYSIEGGYPVVPNRWKSVFNGSTWTWNEKRQQFYYHKFATVQPDLNYRNENVKEEMKNVIKFWFDRGISGFRFDAPLCFFEDKYLRETDNDNIFFDPRTSNLPESFHLMHEFRLFVDEYNREHGGNERFITVEAAGLPYQVAKYYGTKGYPIAHFAFCYSFGYLNIRMSAIFYDAVINFGLLYLPEGERLSWVTDNHDLFRAGTRLGLDYRDIYAITIGLIPGIVHYYYGQEIGALNGYIREEQIVDRTHSGLRDPARLPMQWDNSLNAGFSTNETVIIPPNPDYPERNVKLQRMQKKSYYHIIKAINLLRKTETIKYGKYQSLVYSPNVHIFWRSYEGYETYFVVTNLGDQFETINLKKIEQIPRKLTVVVTSLNTDYEKGYTIGSLDLHEFILKPFSCVVFSSSSHKWSE